MAENEVLDLAITRARLWKAVLEAVTKGASTEKVGSLTEQAFKKGMRKVLKQFEKCGVTTSDFVRNRESDHELKNLLAKVKHHPDADLLVQVIKSYPDASPIDCFIRWLNAILDKFFGDFGMTLVDTDLFSSFDATEDFTGKVRIMLQSNLLELASKLNAKPDYKPVYRSKKGEVKVDPTASQLHVSLIGRSKE